MTKWEYWSVQEFAELGRGVNQVRASVMAQVSAQGLEGWELVSYLTVPWQQPGTMVVIAVMKRPIEE